MNTKVENRPGSQEFLKHFKDPEAVTNYAAGVTRFVPGIEALHRMTGVLLAEKVPADGHILVLGAGGGMELKALANGYSSWSFTGVDPAAEMLRQAERTLGQDAERCKLIEGYIDDAPEGPFDGAVCLLTLHFLDREERRRTASEIRRRLKPGTPFVTAHTSFPQDKEAKSRWLSRYAAFAVASGADPAIAKQTKETVAASLDLFDPEEDALILQEAGFQGEELFYAAFTWRGWVCYA